MYIMLYYIIYYILFHSVPYLYYLINFLLLMSVVEEKVIDGDETFKNYMYEFITKAYAEKVDDKAIAEYIRIKLEEKEPGKWNVVVGRDFGSHVVHLSKRYGYWKLGEQSILIWQSG